MARDEVYFEMIRMGGSVRVSALHTASLTEVVVVCPATSTEQQMKVLALQKLRYVLAKGPEAKPPSS